jgi:hypothetical protein
MKLKVANGGAALAVSDENFGRVTTRRWCSRWSTPTWLRAAPAPRRRRRAPKCVAAAASRGPEGHRLGARRLDPQPDLGRRRPHLCRAAARLHAEGEPQDVSRRDPLDALRAGAQDRLLVTDAIALEAPKTKLLLTQLKSLALEDVLIIVEARTRSCFSRRATCRTSRCWPQRRQSGEPGATTKCWRRWRR